MTQISRDVQAEPTSTRRHTHLVRPAQEQAASLPTSTKPVNHRALLRLLQTQPVFSRWSQDELIAITPFVWRIDLGKQQSLFDGIHGICNEKINTDNTHQSSQQHSEGANSPSENVLSDNPNHAMTEAIYFVIKGELTQEATVYTPESQVIGLSQLFAEPLNSKTLVATCPSVVYAIPKRLFPSLNQAKQAQPSRFLQLYFQRWLTAATPLEATTDSTAETSENIELDDSLTALVEQTKTPRIEANTTNETLTDTSEQTSSRAIWKTIFSWVFAIAVPASVYAFSEMYALSWTQEYYLIILSGCLVLLLLGIVADYAAVLAAALACLLLDIVPVDVIMSGFASGGFFMALSIFGLGSVLVRSGLAMRLILLILRICPETRFSQNLAILCTGILLTPCLPSANTRLTLLAPLIKNTSRAVGYTDNSKATTQMMASMFFGCTIFSPFFLTGKSLNFVMVDMLPQQVSEEYQWMNWLLAAGGCALIIFVGYVLVTQWIFRRCQQPLVSKTHLITQLKLKGKLSKAEWVALIGILLFINAITQYGFHKISLFWVGFGFFVLFLMVEALSDDNIGNDIEWDALLLIGFFIGLENALKYTGIGELITNSLSGVTAALDGSTYLFVVFNIVLIYILRLFLPITTTGVLVGSISLPLAKVNGLDPWLTCLIILILVECWIYPKQASYNASYSAACQGELTHDPALFQRINLLSIVIRIAGLFAFIFALEWMGKI